MANKLKYDFLRVEFKRLYDDINEIIENYYADNILEQIRNLLSHIIYYIYKKNNLYYSRELEYRESLQELKDLNLISDDIEEILIILYGKINLYESTTNTVKSNEKIRKLILKNCNLVYEVIVWLVINYGEENYQLFLDGIDEEEREIFTKYIFDKEISSGDDCDLSLLNNEELIAEVSHLVEIGENYYLGRGCNKDNKEALKYFLKAAEYGEQYAEAYIGLFYYSGFVVNRDYCIAAKWYYKSAAKGNAFSQNALGVMYLMGTGVEQDYTKAMMWFQKSAESDYSPSYYQMARMYYNSLGVEKDLEKAFNWYKRAAELNLPAAQHALSFMYKNGEGCEKSNIKAYYWLELAAENEFEDAYYIIGKSYLDGICMETNYEKAYFYLKKGYESLDVNCIESLGDMYLNGYFVEKNIFTALELYNISIEYGNKSIYYKLGRIYEGEGLVDDAIDLYIQGDKEKDIKCTQRLGVIYYNGEGVKRDIDRAIKYMEKAAENKAPHAMYVLGVAYLRLNKFKEKTLEKSISILKEAYELGSPYAAEYLALVLINQYKEGKEIDQTKLLEYIEFGVDNGLADSIYQYGYVYEKGISVEINYEKAYKYYFEAVENKCIKAINRIAKWYLRGIYLCQDIDLSIKWYETAAELNDIHSIEKLIEIYEKGFGGKYKPIKAIYYLFKLIDLDALKGKSKLAYYCFKGLGIEENIERGYELINEIYDIDKGTACSLKGILAIEKHIKIEQDEIIDILFEGINSGNYDCYGNLAQYLLDNGLNKVDKYKKYYDIALEGKKLGNKQCIYVYLVDKIIDIQQTSIVTLEEIALINQLRELINRGYYQGINFLANWYYTRNKKEMSIYYKLKEQAVFYNLDKI